MIVPVSLIFSSPFLSEQDVAREKIDKTKNNIKVLYPIFIIGPDSGKDYMPDRKGILYPK